MSEMSSSNGGKFLEHFANVDEYKQVMSIFIINWEEIGFILDDLF